MRERLQAAGGVWVLGAGLVVAAVLVPVLSLVWTALQADTAHWQHLIAHVLPQASLNTLLLLVGVGTITLVLGTGCAWLVTAYVFPGRRVLAWALLLPLAMPSYIVAFAYNDVLHPIGPVQTALRFLLGYDSPRQWRLPDIRSLSGAAVLLGLVLYPYVYLSARAAFLSQSAHVIEAARSLGQSAWGVLCRVVLPLARPALLAGLSLALLEALNDIGASEFLGVTTLTTSIYTTWVTRSNLAGASQIALCLLAGVVLLVSLEQQSRAQLRFANVQDVRLMQPKRLRGAWAAAACLLGALPVLMGFAVPAAYLVQQSLKRVLQTGTVSDALLESLRNTVGMAVAVTTVAVLAGLVVAWAARQGMAARAPALWPVRLASLGYAMPGTVLAVGLLPPALAFDGALAHALDVSGLPLMQMAVLLVWGCSLRFVAIAAASVQQGLLRLPPALEQAARLLGEKPGGVLRRVHLPLLRQALISAALMVFVDAMKELPATLLLRPANFETLSTWLYAEAARGTYEEGAIAALCIVLAGIVPVILLALHQENALHQRPKEPE